MKLDLISRCRSANSYTVALYIYGAISRLFLLNGTWQPVTKLSCVSKQLVAEQRGSGVEYISYVETTV